MPEMSATIDKLTAALCKAQGEIENADKSKSALVQKGSNAKRRYADLADARNATREALSKNGLSIIQPVESNLIEKTITVHTILFHESGEFIKTVLNVSTDTQTGQYGIQAVGSAISYARRYAYFGILCLAADNDDDGAQVVEEQRRGQSDNQPQPAPKTPNPTEARGKNAVTQLFALAQNNGFQWKDVERLTGVKSTAHGNYLAQQGEFEKIEAAIVTLQAEIDKAKQPEATQPDPTPQASQAPLNPERKALFDEVVYFKDEFMRLGKTEAEFFQEMGIPGFKGTATEDVKAALERIKPIHARLLAQEYKPLPLDGFPTEDEQNIPY